MEIRQLKAFLAIAEARTFTAAAQRIHYTQAALSVLLGKRRFIRNRLLKLIRLSRHRQKK